MLAIIGRVLRLVRLMDVMYFVGDYLYKKSLRFTGATAAVSFVGYLGNFLPGIDTYSARVAVLLPLAVGGATLTGGLVLRTIPSMIAKRMIAVAQAQDMDLMEDYRKAREDLHLQSLWDRVYRFEWQLGTAITQVREHPEEAPHDCCFLPQDGMNPAEHGCAEYVSRAKFALLRPQPQCRQRYHLGLDLRFLEDWRNGGYFDRDDLKLIEQFDGSAVIEAVKDEAGYGRAAALHDLPLRLKQRFWTNILTRAVGMWVGEEITRLNDAYDTDCFNAQVILWPGEDRQPWLEQYPGSADEIRARRKVILDRVFGDTDDVARLTVEQMALPSFLLATRLRLRYDPEYLDGSLGYDLLGDFADIPTPEKRLAAFRATVAEVVEERAALAACLAKHRPELACAEHGESLRAVRVALHARRKAVRKLLLREASGKLRKGKFARRVMPLVDRAIDQRHRYTVRLVALRMHHELTRLHHREHVELIHTLRHAT